MTVSVSNKIKELKEPVVLQGFTAQEKKKSRHQYSNKIISQTDVQMLITLKCCKHINKNDYLCIMLALLHQAADKR